MLFSIFEEQILALSLLSIVVDIHVLFIQLVGTQIFSVLYHTVFSTYNFVFFAIGIFFFFLYTVALDSATKLLMTFMQLISRFMRSVILELIPRVFLRSSYTIVLYLFISMVAFNMLALLPLAKTFFAQLFTVLCVAFFFWYTNVVQLIQLFSVRLVNFFLIEHVGGMLLVLICCLELLSYSFRFISIALRIFANLVAGHIIIGFITLTTYLVLGTWYGTAFLFICSSSLLLLILCVLYLFEAFVALLQAYIFSLLILLYLRDTLAAFTIELACGRGQYAHA